MLFKNQILVYTKGSDAHKTDAPYVQEREENRIMAYLKLPINHLREGLVIKGNVYSHSGVLLYEDGTVISRDVIARLTRHFIDSVTVEYTRPGEQEPVCVGEEG